jgi:hypothetical protein
VNWVGDQGPPERRELLFGRTQAELDDTVRRIAAGAKRDQGAQPAEPSEAG